MTMTTEVVTSWSVAIVKTSIALMPVRPQQTKTWTWFLYAIVGIRVVVVIYVAIVQPRLPLSSRGYGASV